MTRDVARHVTLRRVPSSCAVPEPMALRDGQEVDSPLGLEPQSQFRVGSIHRVAHDPGRQDASGERTPEHRFGEIPPVAKRTDFSTPASARRCESPTHALGQVEGLI
jgi:hypothetical protein